MGILALLAERPMHGYQLRGEFERRTGGTWPVNVGQVYTTLRRLERDGLVEPVADERAGDTDPYRLTSAGRELVGAWWTAPVERGAPERDELAIKLALAVGAPGVDVRRVVQAQRKESLRVLRDYTRMQARAAHDEQPDLAWELVLDHLVFGLEAEVRWLDHVQGRVESAARRRGAMRPPDERRASDAVARASGARGTDEGRVSDEAVARTGEDVAR
jgi:DNA-binding PadR family transcriptional regulator